MKKPLMEVGAICKLMVDGVQGYRDNDEGAADAAGLMFEGQEGASDGKNILG